jgi:hypothetical protein
MARGRTLESLQETTIEIETRCVKPALTVLDEMGHKAVRACVRDVMIGVTLSPWRSADLLIVLYRNAAMVLGILRVYNSRPRVTEQLMILKDVLAIVATVEFINLGSRLLQNLTACVPGLGRFTDDVAQGLGAGLLTSVAGHAAIARCRAFQGWDREAARKAIHVKLRAFLNDLRGIVIKDILPALGKDVGDKIERIKDGLAAAVDKTNEMMDSFVRRPAVAAGPRVAGAGYRTRRAVADTTVAAWRKTKAGVRIAGSAARGASTAAWKGLTSLAGRTAAAVRRRRHRNGPSEKR